jgi:copper chaperone CopZ
LETKKMNRKTVGGLGLAVMLALGAGCFRNTVSEIELKVPAMKTEACGQLVQAAVARLGEGAIRDIRIDVPARTAWVTYDNVRLGRRNIEVAVRHAGFTVNDLPAPEEARAKLEPECRGDE